jgi:uncharacterized protein HemX
MTTKNGRNGNIVKWLAIIIALGLAIVGWAYNLGVQGEKLNANCADDEKVHPIVNNLDTRLTRVEVNQETMKRDMERQTTMQQKILDKQQLILDIIER